ncbi:MAG: hypothetical protein ISR65_18475 [Bacteriovoracaceae bacterium]|nr:hypothetical protein [Bacteriovoracaceae bacterium]
MKRPYGITFEIGCRNINGARKWHIYLWKLKLRKMRPSYKGQDDTHGGFKLDFLIGRLRRPVPRFYKKEFWSKDYVTKQQATNPWNSGNHWFMLNIPVFLGLFISISYGAGERQPGLYLGTKTYEVNYISQSLKTYMPNKNDKIDDTIAPWGSLKERGNIYMALSASIREDLVD